MLTFFEELGVIKNFVRHMARKGSTHNLSVALVAGLLAERLGLEPKRLYLGGLLHDVGGIGIFENLIAEPLFHEEFFEKDSEFWLHPEVSYKIVNEFLGLDIPEIKEHHELFNGKGYPAKRGYDEVSVGGYVIGISDKFEILSKNWEYNFQDILRTIKSWRGKMYPSFIIDEFIDLFREEKRLLYDIRHPSCLELRLKDLERRLDFSDVRLKKDNLFRFFSIAVALKHPYTGEHSERVSLLVKKVGESIGLDDESLNVLVASAYYHDIGKVVIPRGVLDKPTVLTPSEARIMKEHSLKTYEILNISDHTRDLAFIASCHHEAVDGSGYPLGLSGEDIPLMSRIINIVDIYDALTSLRSYRDAYSKKEALDIMEKEFKGKIDLGLFETFKKILKEMEYEL